MKKLLMAAAALVALVATSSAWAADLPPPPVYKAPPPAPLYDWTGFYVGGNIGGSLGRANTDWTAAGAPLASTSANMDGILGGLQAGYNWQSGKWVLGLEADFQGTSQDGSSSNTDSITTTTTTTTPGTPVCPPTAIACFPGTPVTTTTTTTSNAALSDQEKLPWFGTVRARLGVTPDPRWLVYATGGLAYGEVQSSGSVTVAGTTVTGSSNTTRAGWTVGGGVEAALWDNWSVKLEYLYIDLGNASNTYTGIAPFTPVVTSSHVTDNILRIGFNYRFGGPVVARY
jgi:outer membrane immunogenic protein